MALLEFDSSAAMTAGEKRSLAQRTRGLYADHMDAEADHVAVTIRERTDAEISIGRADSDLPCLVLQVEIREGQPLEAKRAFAAAVMELSQELWRIPDPNMTVVFTEHSDEHLMGGDRLDGE